MQVDTSKPADKNPPQSANQRTESKGSSPPNVKRRLFSDAGASPDSKLMKGPNPTNRNPSLE